MNKRFTRKDADDFIETVPKDGIVLWHFFLYDQLGQSLEVKFIVCPNDVKHIPRFVGNQIIVNQVIAILKNGTDEEIESQLVHTYRIRPYDGLQPAFDFKGGVGSVCSPMYYTEMKDILKYVRENKKR